MSIRRVPKEMKEYINARRRRERWASVVACLACVVVFCTVYALILPAITLEHDVYCGKTEHTHDADCYGKTVICEAGEDDNHTHTEDCYESVLICEEKEHTHTEDCYVDLTETDDPAKSGESVLLTPDADVVSTGIDDSVIRLSAGDGDDTDTVSDTVTDNTVTTYEKLNGFFLWLKLFYLEGNTKDIYSNPEWKDGIGFTSDGIKDALKYEEGGETYYLIPVSYFTKYYKEYGYTFDPDETADCPFVYAPNANQNASNLEPAAYIYVQWDEENIFGWYVRVQDKGSYTDPATPRSNIYYTQRASVVTDTVSPGGTVINLFDYWVTGKIEDDIATKQENYTLGINADHALKFKPTGLSGANAWTGNAGVYQGIVANRLGEDGYPVLSGESIFGNENGELVSSTESLAYLFDPTYSGEADTYRDVYRNVSGLLQVNEGGYYYYDSTKNYADFNESKNSFTLYDDWAITYTPSTGNTTRGQFFPFDDYDTVNKSISANSSALNHYFGMTLTARFIQQYGGYTDSNQKTAMIFDFSGDDDVWIFIDGVLVADLGGIHDAASVDINFSTGIITVNAGTIYEKKSTIKDAFIAAGKASEEDTDGWKGNTFADETYHTLKFYYLERGSFASNLKLTYNLNSYPPTSIYKVNQYGQTVEGAIFAVYASDENYNIYSDLPGKRGAAVNLPERYAYDGEGNIVSVDDNGNATSTVLARSLYTGTTDSDGEMVFLDEDGVPYTLTELEEMFGEHFILKEIEVPEGYRLVSDTIKLHIYNHKIMLCENTYTSGVYASAQLQVTAPNILKKAGSEETITYLDENASVNGILFAVVLKYVGPRDEAGNATALTSRDSWAPVYGTNEEGFTIVDEIGENNAEFIDAAIFAANQYKESKNVFEMSQSGQMQGQLNGMPGNIANYYYMLTDANKGKTQYTVAYYWSEADSLAEATSENTFRIDGDVEGYAMSRSFGATIEVPNLLNRLVVQKLDSEGDLVNGAVFGLYEVEEWGDASEEIYYVGYTNDENETKTLICLGPDDGSEQDDDTKGNNKGLARLSGGSDRSGTYEIITTPDSPYGKTGTIAVKIENTEYIIAPVDTAVTVPKKDGKADDTDKENAIDEDGSASFTNMDNGFYYLREIAAPVGYLLNTTEVMVLVDDTAVYANAGVEDDGVTVARGPGYVVSTLDQFASQGQIDNTLTWVYEQMLVSGVSSSFFDVYDALEEDGGWEYLKSYTGSGYSAVTETTQTHSQALTTYLVYDKGGENTLFNYTVNGGRYKNGDTTGITRRLYTSVGWSYYLLYQDYEYGLKRHGTANYTDLAGEEISNLFSRSTFVQVADKNENGTLKISKTVKNIANADDADADFSFTVDLKDSGGNALAGTYAYTVYEGSTKDEIVKGNISYDADTDTCSGVIRLKDGQEAVIDCIPYAAHYTVTEEQNTRYSTSAVRDDGKDPITGIPNTGEQLFYSNTVTGTLYWAVKTDEEGREILDSTSTVDYTNSYLKDLLIWKTDAGNNDVTLSGAEFTLTKEENGSKLYYTEAGEWSGSYAAIVTNEYGYIDLDVEKLNNGAYTLTEVRAPDGYYLLDGTISFMIKDGKFTNAEFEASTADGSADSTNLISITDEGLSLMVSNTSSYELPETGGTGTMLFTVGGLLLMAGTVCCGCKWMCRRERRLKT